MKKTRHVSSALLLSGALLFSPAAFALSLGEVQIHSKLNQTLDAEIEILSATQEEINALKVSVPEYEVFSRYDIERNFLVANLSFDIEERGGGRHVIRVSSSQPVKEPFVTFLVQADWRQGKLLREYTVLVDPPTFVPGQTSTTTTSIDPASTSTYSTGTITRGDVIATTSAPSYEPPETYRIPDATSDGTRMVQVGDTLSKIARDVKPSSVSLDQAMLAIYRENPEAFDGNINLLKAGKRLTIPSASQFGQIDRSSANSEVKEQMADWRAGRRSGRLELRVPDLTTDTDSTETTNDSGLIGTTGSSSVDSSTLSAADRLVVNELEEKLNELERAVVLKDSEIAALQEQIRALQAGEEVDLETLASDINNAIETSDVQTDSNIIDDLGTITSDSSTETETVDISSTNDTSSSDITDPNDINQILDAGSSETETETETETTTSVIETPKVAAPAQLGTPWWKSILGFLPWVLGALLLAIAGLFGYRKFNNKQPDRDSLFIDDELDSAVENIAESVKTNVESRYTAQLPALDLDNPDDFDISADPTVESEQLNDPFSVDVGDNLSIGEDAGGYYEEDATLPGIDDESFDPGATTVEVETKGSTVESDAALPFEETTLADATNLSGSIELDQNNPIAEADFHMAYGLYDQAVDLVKGAIAEEDKIEYKEKLLEIYFVSGNKDEFINYASSLKDTLTSDHPKVWDSVTIMGKQLSPEDPLFSGDLSSNESSDGLDFAFDEIGTTALQVDDSLFADAADSIDATAADNEALDVDFAFDADQTVQTDISHSLDFDLDTDLNFDTDIESGDTLIGETGMSEVLSMDDTESTLQLDSGDLDMDIGTATGVTADLSDDMESILDQTSDTLEVAGVDSLDFDIGELGLPSSEDLATELDDIDESELTLDFAAGNDSLETGEFNFDQALVGVDDDPFPDSTLTDMAEELGKELPGSYLGDDEHASTAQIGEDELERMGLSSKPAENNADIMDATNFGFDDMELGDEVSTKLDLARAYIEMDDAENAKSILSEVLAEGNEQQASEAQGLLDDLA